MFLHGGPGSGLSAGYLGSFDMDRQLVMGLDQRGCGRSRPLASDPAVLATLTTDVLIADLEALRRHLGIDRWLVVGGSWGTTLALAYAQAHAERVTRLALGERPVDAYARLLRDRDPGVRSAAAAAWRTWEDVHVSLAPGHQPSPRYLDPDIRAVFAAQVTHFWSQRAFQGDHGILDSAFQLAGIPTVLIHGRWDLSSPLQTAWRLHHAIAGSELVVLADEGHGGRSMNAAPREAIERL